MSADNKDILQTALDFVRAVQNRTSPDDISRFYHPDIVQTEYPNGITKNTVHRDLQALKDAAIRGSKVMQRERYEVVNTHVNGNTVVLEVIWIGTLAIPIGNLPAGGEMKAYIAQFYEFKDGKVIKQRNYDCFEPF